MQQHMQHQSPLTPLCVRTRYQARPCTLRTLAVAGSIRTCTDKLRDLFTIAANAQVLTATPGPRHEPHVFSPICFQAPSLDDAGRAARTAHYTALLANLEL